jgi:hypothetical protein
MSSSPRINSCSPRPTDDAAARRRGPRLFILALFWIALPLAGHGALRNHVHPRASVDWAVTRLTQSLREAGVPERQENITIDRDRDPSNPEGFTLSIDGNSVLISGADSTGAMYGVFELTEQISNAGQVGSWNALLPYLKATTQSPYLRVRADNSFLHDAPPTRLSRCAQRLHLAVTPRVLEDPGMWEQYIDMLAGNRFNMLDLHGGYNRRTTQFFNLLPALVTVPGYERIGKPAIQRKNLAALQELVRYAKHRGVTVALMNYSAKVDGLSASELRDYTKKAVRLLRQELPGLARLGFRTGESGEDFSFFQETYAPDPVAGTGLEIPLYTRSWRSSADEIERLASESARGIDVEVKFNGEHLGLPYQGILGPAHHRYGYGDFLRPDAHFRVIWQVRANGTHRFWTWAQTDFVRRTVRACRLGDARGLSLEPPTAYFSPRAADYYRDPEDQSVYSYIWQKHWAWYLAWGRLAYNPELPTATIVARYAERFGEPGAPIYEALQESGKVVPLVMAYRFVGPDQRNTSPETQTGAFDPEKDEPIDVLTYARNTPMDSRSFAGIDSFVQEKIGGSPDGRVGPACIADRLAAAAAAARRHVATLEGHVSQHPKEWQLLRTDILAACFLGEFHAARIAGTMHLDYALRTNNADEYAQARDFLSHSRLSWGQLTFACDSVYRPIDDPLLNQISSTWGSQIDRLAKLDATVPGVWATRATAPQGPPLVLTPHDRGEPLRVSVSELFTGEASHGEFKFHCHPSPASEIRRVTLWLKRTAGAERWSSQKMTATDDGTFVATAPASPDGYLALVEITNTRNESAQYPAVLEATPYWWIRPIHTRARRSL